MIIRERIINVININKIISVIVELNFNLIELIRSILILESSKFSSLIE